MKKIILFALVLGFISTNSQAQQKFNESTANTKKIATKYFNTYLDLDFESLRKMMHQNISFEDPTAKHIFGGVKQEGIENVYKNFKNAYASIIEMKQKNLQAFFSSETGVFKFTITWSYRSNQLNKVITVSMPLVIVLTVNDNKVVKHVDYGDYTEYLKQIKQQQSSK